MITGCLDKTEIILVEDSVHKLKNIASKLLNLHLDKETEYLDSYENITLLGDFNMTPGDKNVLHVTNILSFKRLISGS